MPLASERTLRATAPTAERLPMNSFLEELAARLRALRSDGLQRTLRLPEGIDFSSNDYLGLASHPGLRSRLLEELPHVPLSAPASRLLRGNTAEHERLELRLARFKGAEASLFFPSGYQANVALLSTILKRDDLALTDAANHASIVDGIRLAGARMEVFPHLDVDALRGLLERKPQRGRVFVITESLYSMDGDTAPLDRYADLSEAHGASLIVDDAHSTGLFGERGSGLVEALGVTSRVLATVSTCGKALGLCGAFVAGPRVLIDYLIGRARPFIFSTAPPPWLLRAVGIALDIVGEEPDRRRRALELADRLRGRLRAGGVSCPSVVGPIVPVILGDNDRAMRTAEAVRRQGYDVRGIRPPAVPPRTARIRVSVHADHTESQIDGLARALIAEIAKQRASVAPTGEAST